jgi:hypothetical protein
MIHENWALFSEIGLWGWIAAAVGLILQAFPDRDTIKKVPAALWGGSLLVFYVIWCVGMLNA